MCFLITGKRQKIICQKLYGMISSLLEFIPKPFAHRIHFDSEWILILQVKLNPSLGDAWLCLGNCIWKKGDLPSARNCFSLALSKVRNAPIKFSF